MKFPLLIRRLVTAGVSAILAATLVSFVQAPAIAAGDRLSPQWDESVPGVDGNPGGSDMPSTGTPFNPQAPVWPSGAAEVDVPGLGKGLLEDLTRGRGADASGGLRPLGELAKAGDLPIRVGASEQSADALSRGNGLADKLSNVGRARVQVLDREQTQNAGVVGLLLRVSRADGVSEDGSLTLAVDYSDFAYAYGADWGSRLQLVAIPQCALVTPEAPECAPVPLESSNDLENKSVSAEVDLADAEDASTESSAAESDGDSAPQARTMSAQDGPSMLVAATASPSGAAGDFTATSLQPSSSWEAGGSSGNFGWSYPLRTPSVPGGLGPNVGLSYSSQSVDGRMAASNNQPSWIGEGFEYTPGFIERTYQTCSKKDDGVSPDTGDLCWGTDKAFLSLNGTSTELIYEAGKGWHGRADDGSRIEHLTGANNGDDNGEWWVVTAPNGTKYYFGNATRSTYTVPVYHGQSEKTEAWRWNLDYVIDVHGNTIDLFYQKEIGYYARKGDAYDLAAYVRGGWLDRIDYGSRADATQPSARVTFGTGDRCVTANCGSHDAANWPDTPWDLECTSGPCYTGSPTFWSTRRLSSVTTQVFNGSGWDSVESWTLHHTFPDPGDGTRAGLWLDRISHTGHAGGQNTTLPDVRFAGVQMPNRVDTIDHSPPMNWWRMSTIATETGGRINVNYSGQECVAGSIMPPNPESNTMRCYPVRWTPPGYTDPVVDWFHKYVVTRVTESDDVGGNVRVVHKYEYEGGAAWRYTDDDGMIDAEDKTWSQWRGYGKVRTITGDPAEQQLSETTYFRGMHGDTLPGGGTRSVQLPAAGGAPAINDEDGYAGMARETVTFNGSAQVSVQVFEPWQSVPTATRTINNSTVYARMTGMRATHSRTALDGGRADRTQTTVSTRDGYGRVVKTEDSGDEAISGDEQCVLTEYAPRNESVWLTQLIQRVQIFAVDCAAAEVGGLGKEEIVSDTRTSYDGQTYGATPGKGDVTTVENLKALDGATPVYHTTASSAYDKWGRITSATDVKGHTTTTAYTHNAGGQVTTTTVTNHLGWETTTTSEPALGAATSTTDPNGRTTEMSYDGLGRLTGVWLPGRDKGSQSASMTYAYLVRDNAPTVVSSSQLNTRAEYVTTHTLYDGLLRERQTQTPEAGTTGGRLITDVIYDSAGRSKLNLGPYAADGAAGTDLFTATLQESIKTQTKTVFDGAGRPIQQIFQPNGIAKYTSTTAYGGDHVEVTPPAGQVPTSTLTDIRGNTVELRQYHGESAGVGAYDATSYTYDNKGQQTKATDPAGNSWAYDYDLLGRQISASDPDEGVTSSAYNDFGELTSTTDARGITLAYAYDELGRKTAVHEKDLNGVKRAEWVYDTLAKGQQTKSVRYEDGQAYVNEVLNIDTGYRPTRTRITIPATETGLGGSYIYIHGYYANGQPRMTRLPYFGGLPRETLTYDYNHLDQPTLLSTNVNSGWLANARYTRQGELGVLGRWYEGGAASFIDQGFYYQEDTRRLSRLLSKREANPSVISDLHYSYDDGGNITAVGDQTPGAEEQQCFSYDHLRRLTDAWTPSDLDCSAGPSQALGGPAPYWQSWTFDTVGNRLSQTDHKATGDQSVSYTYPAAGGNQPHALQSTDDGTTTRNFGYDAAGNTVSRDGKTLAWNAEGHLQNFDGTSYLYDADGNRLIARDADGATLYLPGQELRHDNNGGIKTGTSYYSLAGHTVAMRKNGELTWLISDHQGTAQASMTDTTSQNYQRRYQTPYGEGRGNTATWPNDKGYLGGTNDSTGLTHLGAREYDPALGRFISVDPLMDLADPQQWNAYTYSNGSPITMSDPDGLRPVSGQTADDDVKQGVSWSKNSGGTWAPSYESNYDPGYYNVCYAGGSVEEAPSAGDAVFNKVTSAGSWLGHQWLGTIGGSTETIWNAGKGLVQTGWDCSAIGMMAADTNCGLYDLAALTIDDPGAAGTLVWNGVVDPITTDWKNGDYGSALGRGGAEVTMLIYGPKGTGALGKATKASTAAAKATPASTGASKIVNGIGHKLANGNNFLRVGSPSPGAPSRVSIGPAYNHYEKYGPVGRALNPIHIHMERRYGGIDFNWFTKMSQGKKPKPVARNWTWWGN